MGWNSNSHLSIFNLHSNYRVLRSRNESHDGKCPFASLHHKSVRSAHDDVGGLIGLDGIATVIRAFIHLNISMCIQIIAY